MVVRTSNKPDNVLFTSKGKNITVADEEHIKIFFHEMTIRMEARLANFRRLFKGETEVAENCYNLSPSYVRN